MFHRILITIMFHLPWREVSLHTPPRDDHVCNSMCYSPRLTQEHILTACTWLQFSIVSLCTGHVNRECASTNKLGLALLLCHAEIQYITDSTTGDTLAVNGISYNSLILIYISCFKYEGSGKKRIKMEYAPFVDDRITGRKCKDSTVVMCRNVTKEI